MTVTDSGNPPGAREIIVHDEIGPRKFCGAVVVDLSWTYDAAAERGHKRWTDITLYRVIQESSDYQYVVQVVGRSVVYHTSGGPCHKGVGVEVRLLYADDDRYQALEPCPRCAPDDLEDFAPTDMVAIEEDLSSLYLCANADEVVSALYRRGDMSGKRPPGQLSSLSVKLLTAACRIDKDIEAAMMNARQL